MKQYIAVTESGRRIILHGDRAVEEYNRDVAAGEAEPLQRGPVLARLDPEEHKFLRDLGLCYGPCEAD